MENIDFWRGFEKVAIDSKKLIDAVSKAFKSRSYKIYPYKKNSFGRSVRGETDYTLAVKTNEQMKRITDLLKKRPDIKKAVDAKEGRHLIGGPHQELKNKMFQLKKDQMTVRSSANTAKKKTNFKDQADGKY